jgi:23S rRNA pseudouridine2605 synthase
VLLRLQKILSAAGVASRRAAERMITEGRVTVNGTVVTTLGTRADAGLDEVRVDGVRVGGAEPLRYLLLNKPRGFLSTRSDPRGRPTVIDLLEGAEERLYPLGRLDWDSEGLLLLTNDGDLAARLMHPRHGVPREYHARVRGVPDPRAIQRLERGVILDGRKTLPAEVSIIETGRGARGDQAVVSIILREGRTRQVRRMCEAVGHPVVRLRRVRIGPIADPSLRTGAFRDLTSAEVKALKGAVAGKRSDESTLVARHSRLIAKGPMKALIIAIDGPSGVGKGTVSRAIAKSLGYRHVDTGAMYRAVAWSALRQGLPLDDEERMTQLAEGATIEVDGERVLVDGIDVSRAIRTGEMDQASSTVSRLPGVRAVLVRRQRELGAGGGVVMEGRDIGTVVFPAADVKIYLDATPEERARRRAGDPAHRTARDLPLAAVVDELAVRDARDRTRATSPLSVAADATLIDTTTLSIADVVERVLEIVREKTASSRQ